MFFLGGGGGKVLNADWPPLSPHAVVLLFRFLFFFGFITMCLFGFVLFGFCSFFVSTKEKEEEDNRPEMKHERKNEIELEKKFKRNEMKSLFCLKKKRKENYTPKKKDKPDDEPTKQFGGNGSMLLNCVFPGFDVVLPSFTGFYRVLSSLTGFYLVLVGFTGFYWVIPSFTGFYWVLLGFTGFYWVLPALEGLQSIVS